MLRLLFAAAAWGGAICCSAAAPAAPFRSHPSLRDVTPPIGRAVEPGPTYYVDAARGDDAAVGGQETPWRTIGRAVRTLQAGDTLLLRGGTYRENVRLSFVGREGAPISIQSHPGEQAILDGGLAEFFDRPAECWEPFADGAPGEYRSIARYPNLRNVVASFGDSLVGLNSYYHVQDLRAAAEHVERREDKTDVKPVYCGPGLWYDRASGYLHARFAPTHLPEVDNYAGESDPRKLPLVVAPFRSLPLHLDGAAHVRIRDLTIRGGGFNTILVDQSRDIELDNVTVWCGTYGLRAKGAEKLRILRCGFYGNSPPWQTRYDAGFNTYPGRSERDITRLNTHSWLTAEANDEFDVYCYPFSDDWEIAGCEFGDAGADGLYLGGVNLRFHHNRVDNATDDGIYLSPMYARHFYLRGGATLHLYQNHFSRCLTMLAYGGTDGTQDKVYFYRNLVELRTPVRVGRPAEPGGTVQPYAGKLMGDHGSPQWSSLFCYHNTFVAATPALGADMFLLRGATAERPRRMFNNILVHAGAWLPHVPGTEHAHVDGNLFWQPGLAEKAGAEFFATYRASPAFAESKAWRPEGFDARSLVADPKFAAWELEGRPAGDYRLQAGSPAIDAGVDIPADWPDPLRPQDRDRPDVGELPLGADQIDTGRAAKW